jgi:superfamily II DNA or RNA helicase
MSKSKLMKVTYYDPKAEVCLTTYADTLVCDTNENTIAAIRFGGYPEMVKGMTDAIFGGGSVDIELSGKLLRFNSQAKQYRRQITHDGIYAESTLLISDDEQTAVNAEQEEIDRPKRTYIFCEQNNPKALFDELDRKTSVPLIPQFQDYFLSELQKRNILKPLRVLSLREKFDAWVLTGTQDDKPLIAVIDDGLKSGTIGILGAVVSDDFDEITGVSDYLKTFGVTVANRIKNLFRPLFDPAAETLSQEVTDINSYMQSQTGYSLYDAQLGVSEAIKRQLDRNPVAFLIAECGSGKTKIGSTALHAHQQGKHPGRKTFNIILCPSQITKKWVREIEETLPNTFAGVVTDSEELDRLYSAYQRDNKTAYAVISKEMARDGYMNRPAVRWSRRKKAFLCPDCGRTVTMELTDDGSKYRVNADQFFFRRETSENRVCEDCGSRLWTALNPNNQGEWVKVGSYGFVHRYTAAEHLDGCKDPSAYDVILQISLKPDEYYPAAGAYRRIALSSYIKKTLKGKVNGLILDELHQYSNKSGQGDAMAELVGTAKKAIGMTATLINGYSKGIFYLLFRMAPDLMLKDGREFRKPVDFNKEYGVVESIYELKQAECNANRRTTKTKKKERQLPGVSPLVYSRFLMESAAFLSLVDMGKDLPEYEEIPVALDMKTDVSIEYSHLVGTLKDVLRDKSIGKKVLSAFMNLLMAYPDQPYGHEPIRHPFAPDVILAQAKDESCFEELLEKDLKVLEIVQKKIANRERILIYTNWVRTDTQDKLMKLMADNGIRAEVLPSTVPPAKREEWVEKRVNNGVQVLITNPKLVETGMDLNDFTTLIFYNISYDLFNLRQASRRSWRINQKAPRIEVYFFYYDDTVQFRALRLMASKLAVASIIEGNISDEGLSAMSQCSDMMSQLAKELTLGIKHEVEDIAATFKKMATRRAAGGNGDCGRGDEEIAQVITEKVVLFVPPKPVNVSEGQYGQFSLFDLAS